MAQYIFVSGSFFGDNHNDSPTYAFSMPAGSSGSIFLSGSGGYVNSPTGIPKITLEDTGSFLKVDDNTITQLTCSVEVGFNCTTQEAYFNWIIPSSTPTPTATTTPTPSPNPSTVTFTLDADQESATNVQYDITVTIAGFKSTTKTMTSSGSLVTNTLDLLKTGTVTGTGTITVTRTTPDATTAVTPTTIDVGGTGFTSTPTQKSFNSGDTISNESFSISSFNEGEDISIDISETTA